MERFFKIGLVLMALVLLSFSAITQVGAADYLAVTTSASGGNVQVFDQATGALLN